MIDLVIFDCDGVLVDSEDISCRALARMGVLEGAQIEEDEALLLFRGSKMARCIGEIERRAGRAMPDSFEADVRRAMAVAFETELKAIEGIHDALSEIALPVCVASNGPMAKMMQTLVLTGLFDRFQGNIFSAYDVGSWKPDPGLFLYAARAFGAEPSRCVVVEDSQAGVRAAKAAGIPVLGFTGSGNGAALAGENIELFHNMRELPRLLARVPLAS